MIKLPIMLAEHDTWQNAVTGAINARASLAETAKDDADYIRPIVLFQAQPKNQEVTVEALKNHLMDIEQIPESKIAIATGDQRELDGIDLFDRTCPIEYVITIEALKEGWDCSFAYIFCSVSRIQSATDVEQLLGRVLRMPYAKQRQETDLNKAYAFLSEPSFGEAARALADKLVDMGFEEDEALDNIEPVQRTLDFQRDLFGPQEKPEPVFKYTTPATPEIQGILEFADTDVFMEYHDWSLLDYSPKMDEQEFTIRETARSFEIDLDGNRITSSSNTRAHILPKGRIPPKSERLAHCGSGKAMVRACSWSRRKWSMGRTCGSNLRIYR